MAKKYIDVDRRFYRIDEQAEAFPEDTHLFGDSEYITEGWDKLLARRRVVILAEAGSGKTRELKAQTTKLLDGGKIAFYARVEHLADGNFAKALELGDTKGLGAWKRGTSPVYFFLDSVDEARLTHKRFTAALKTIASTIEGAEEQAHIFITSRPSDWRWDDDIASVQEVLPIRTAAGDEERQSEFPPLSDDALLRPLRDDQRQEKKEPETLGVFVLAGLTPSKIRTFAALRNVACVDEFVDALLEADAVALVSRPQDLNGIIDLWEQQRRIGTHIEALQASIKLRLRETNADQSELRDLSEDQALQGARSVAAALTFARATTIALPEEQRKREGALDIAAILPKWKPKHQRALLSRAIFDPASFGRVRFHQREVQELLTADWLLGLLDKQCPRDTIERLLFAQSYGFDIVRPSLRAVATWVGQRDVRPENSSKNG